ncbi:MAG: ribosomal protein L7/L12 [Methylomonas sp.]|jgi:ribosomal protein L7/L12|uniref:ribosomal protein L7/L12 n=1 Tax=Methylomonas sp. TaxID=418 RepID=UPI00260116E8|nr:ribosomal protein L7/L12 [Methylomonas sp.]MCK9606639.1 ribosomal protein L7/L12 [Methylomonas sp.]
MSSSKPTISEQAAAAANAGNLLEAIKQVREETGLGLKEAKEMVDAYLRHGHAASPTGISHTEMPVAAMLALKNGLLIEAIKHYREHNHCGLKDAKQAVERHIDTNPLLKQQFQAAAKQSGMPFVNLLLVLVLLGLMALGYWYTGGEIR